MRKSSKLRWNSEPGVLDRDYRVIGWWGLALVVFGIAALTIAYASFGPD
jgi:hypothetical protein